MQSMAALEASIDFPDEADIPGEIDLTRPRADRETGPRPRVCPGRRLAVQERPGGVQGRDPRPSQRWQVQPDESPGAEGRRR